MFAPTIDDYLCLSIANLKRLGFLDFDSTKGGNVQWSRNGNVIATISVYASTKQIPFVSVSYTYNGTPKAKDIPLRFQPSNLGLGGYYYFVCPTTGKSCRKLYLVDGNFISREAFNPLYEQQKQSKKQRDGLVSVLVRMSKFEDLIYQKNRRYVYNGRLTPYGRKCEKARRIVMPLFNRLDDF